MTETPSQTLELSKSYPVHFSYDGSDADFATWNPVEVSPQTIRYTSPDGKLALSVEYRTFPGFPVTEIIPVIECIGNEDTAIIENIRSLHLAHPCSSLQLHVRRTTGSKTMQTDFQRNDVMLQSRFGCDTLHITTDEGLSCSTWIPYFGVDINALNGLEIAIGWSGAWRADIQLRKDDFLLDVGLDGARFKMRPNECFSLPTILVMERNGMSVADGLAVFHRFMLEHKAPRDSKGRLFQPWLPTGAGGGNKTDANMLKILDGVNKEFPGFFNVYWVDANWYGEHRETLQPPNCGPDWWKYVGDWHLNTWAHPDGNMKKVSDAVHAAGMKFLVWFEPERATIHAPIVTEHPEFFHRVKENPSDYQFLLDLGNPDARNWAIGEICRNIEESGIDIYRQDNNFTVTLSRIWADNEEPERKGVNEIKHINGLYAFWDELRRRYPDMLLENCAAGGRRMDYQMMSRSHSYCRDDAHMAKNCDEMTQNITLNTTAYIPITGGETFTVPIFDDYAFLSRLAAGTVFTPSDFQGMFLSRTPSKEELDWFRKMFTVAKRIQRYFLGDYYALTDIPFNSSEIFCAYQLHLPDTSEGFIAVFRRKDCLEDTFTATLHGIDRTAVYSVEELDGTVSTMSGNELTRWAITLSSPRSTRWFFYHRIP
ncbi:MAG: alpha-galactosidase [Victivallales bacterium]|nr:alpha-galactosidase [Victivallales bacterium]